MVVPDLGDEEPVKVQHPERFVFNILPALQAPRQPLQGEIAEGCFRDLQAALEDPLAGIRARLQQCSFLRFCRVLQQALVRSQRGDERLRVQDIGHAFIKTEYFANREYGRSRYPSRT